MLRERRAAGRDTGAAAVEFALVMPMLLLLVFGIIQFGYSFFQMQSAEATIGDAARTASLGLDSCGEWDTAVRDAAQGNGMTLTNAEIAAAELHWFRRLPGSSTMAEVSTPRLGDYAMATLEFTPALDMPLVPFPDTLTQTSSVLVQGAGDLASSC